MQFEQVGDTIVVWKLDRSCRSNVQLIEFIEKLKTKGINLKSLLESIDKSTATGNLFFQFMCILAKYERNVIKEKTRAGLASTRC